MKGKNEGQETNCIIQMRRKKNLKKEDIEESKIREEKKVESLKKLNTIKKFQIIEFKEIKNAKVRKPNRWDGGEKLPQLAEV